ncbi:MAG: SprT-like domain-containing protein [Halorhodospira sp.]
MTPPERLTERTHRVELATVEWWQHLMTAYPALAPAPIPRVEWLRRGSTAGRADLRRWVVAFNRPMLQSAQGYRTILPNTVVHELAHLAAFRLFNSHGHDPAWRAIMRRMGFEPRRTHDLDVTDLPGVQRRWRYRCGCGAVHLSTTRHNRIIRGQQVYRCQRCGETLTRWEEEP